LLFAGEHTSTDYNGFMNGAVQSGLRAARQILGRTA
jgi:monoamine oxidase